jgi:hypothetical protein
MNNIAYKRIVAGLVCALLGDIPVRILSIFVHPLNQAGTIGWILISASLFALYLWYFERGKPSSTPTDPGLDQ